MSPFFRFAQRYQEEYSYVTLREVELCKKSNGEICVFKRWTWYLAFKSGREIQKLFAKKELCINQSNLASQTCGNSVVMLNILDTSFLNFSSFVTNICNNIYYQSSISCIMKETSYILVFFFTINIILSYLTWLIFLLVTYLWSILNMNPIQNATLYLLKIM